MDIEENFAFNFHVGEEKKHRRKFVVTGKTVRERSKQRKKIKELKKSEQSLSEYSAGNDPVDTSDGGQAVTTPVSADKPIMKDSKGSESKGGQIMKKLGITSSLFTKNPEVPKIDSSIVGQLKEKVFSDQKFDSVDYLHPHMIKNLQARMNLDTMTAIQYLSIPAIMECAQDVLVQSQTGSGKTLAYAIPVVNRLQAERPQLSRADGTFAVIIVPTRELALQSFECLQKLVYPFTWIVPGCLMGGEKRKAEKARIRKGMNILVATPGRLQDHLDKTESLNLQRLKWIIIDEADRLLDLGYEKSLQEILSKMKEKCEFDQHTVLLSATLSKGVERLAGMSMRDPIRISVSDKKSASEDETEAFAIPESLSQNYVIVPMKLRLVTLSAFIMDKFITSTKPVKIIVFLSTHVSVDFHYDVFKSVVCRSGDGETDTLCGLDNVKVYKLHGEMEQSLRTENYHDFVQTKSGVLFCTDVAARGLHLPQVQWIVQYTAPPSCSDYIHRIGRTARAGSTGNSLLFLLPSESEYIQLLNLKQISLNSLDVHSILGRLIITDGIRQKKALHHQTITQNATQLQNAFEQYVISQNRNSELAGKACLSFIRGYSTYPKNVKHVFNVKELHLGHVAKSFALRQAPKGLGQKYGSKVEVPKFVERKSKKRRVDASQISEFGSGGILKKKKKKVDYNSD